MEYSSHLEWNRFPTIFFSFWLLKLCYTRAGPWGVQPHPLPPASRSLGLDTMVTVSLCRPLYACCILESWQSDLQLLAKYDFRVKFWPPYLLCCRQPIQRPCRVLHCGTTWSMELLDRLKKLEWPVPFWRLFFDHLKSQDSQATKLTNICEKGEDSEPLSPWLPGTTSYGMEALLENKLCTKTVLCEMYAGED